MSNFLSWIWRGVSSVARLAIAIASGVLQLARPAASLAGVVLRTTAVAMLPATLSIAAASAFFERTPPGTIGVRQKNFGHAGIVPTDTRSGLAFSVRGVDTWHFVDRTTQLLSFGVEFVPDARPPIDVRTRDGNLASVSASVAYRVRPGEAHRIVADGLKLGYRDRVRATSERILLQELSNLSSAECSDVEARSARMEIALGELNDALAEVHVEAQNIWIDSVAFGAEYEKKLQQKQLMRQTLLLQRSYAAVERESEKVGVYEKEIEIAEKTIAAEYDQAIEERAAGGRREIAEIRTAAQSDDKTTRAAAQADYDRAVAAGERALARAELEKREHERRILREHGGRFWLARRAAQNLRLNRASWDTRATSVPPLFDLDAWVKLLAGAEPPTTP